MKNMQKNGMDIGLISKYRGQIMGVAIILIMFTHNSMILPGYLGKANSCLRMLAQSGVDIFFLLSGLGCFFSLQSKSIDKFYIKRFVRIFCPYIIVLVIYGLYRVCVRGDVFIEYLNKYGLVSFFTKADLSEWFIAAILATYLLTPFFFRLLKKQETLFFALIVLLYALIIISRLFLGSFKTYNVIVEIWFTRLPTYLFGMLIAKKISEKNTLIPNKKSYLILILATVCMAVTLILFSFKLPSYWLINRLLFLPMILGVILLLVYSFEKSDRVFLKNSFKFLGGITLEIYLIHEKVLGICSGIVKRIIGNEVVESVVANVLAFIIAICLAKILNLLIDRLLKTKKSSRVPQP